MHSLASNTATHNIGQPVTTTAGCPCSLTDCMNMFNVWIGRVSSDGGDGAWVFAETSYNRALDRLAQHCRDNWGEVLESWPFTHDKEESEAAAPGYANKTSDDIVRIYYDTITWEHFDILACPITAEMLAAIPGSIVVGDSVVLTPSTD